MKFRISGIRVTSLLGCTVSEVGIRHGFYQLQLLVGAWPKTPVKLLLSVPRFKRRSLTGKGFGRYHWTTGYTAGLRLSFVTMFVNQEYKKL